MSVLSCNRSGCPNIMCDRYSHKHGYICGDCFQELVDTGIGTNIEEFMDSNKYVHADTTASISRYADEFKFSE